MATYYKYEKYQKYINGVPQDEYKQGNLIGTGEYSSLQDCEEGAIYRWIDSGETICDGYKLCVKEIKQKSTDGGVTWVTTEETRAGTVIDMWSTECGVVIMYRWNPTGRTRCKGYNEEAEYVYQVSYTMGTSWQDVVPKQYKWEVTDVFTDECFLEAEPFTFTFDAGDEGGNLELNTKVDSLYSYWTEDDQTYSADTGRYSINYYANVYTKYAIDWGDGDGPQLYDKSVWEETSDTWSRLEQKPESPFVTTMLKNPMSISNHIYRTGGIKTIKIWGNISYFGCKQVKDFIHWGVPMFNVRINTDSKDLLALLKKKGIKVCDPTYGGCIDKNLTGTKIEGYNNFDKVETTFTGKYFGTMYVYTFAYLTHFDMSNSPNCIYPNPFSKFNNSGRLKTFIADNCTGMTSGPNLSHLGDNENTVLKTISFKNCTSLVYGPIIEMPPYSSGGAIPRGLDLSSEGVFENCPNIEELPFTYNVNVHTVDFKHHPKLHGIKGQLTADSVAGRRNQFYQMCKGLTKLQNIENLTLKGCGFEEAFMDCTMLQEVCKTVITQETEQNDAGLNYMYSNTGMRTVNISKIFENEHDPTTLDCSYMFYNCPKLTKITGSLLVNQHIVNEVKFISMFENCSKLTTISAIFGNKTLLPNMIRMFKNCDITNLPNELFNYTYEGTEVNIPTEMFYGNSHLVNYPIVNQIPMWKLPAFFFGEITQTNAFFNCTPILSAVPMKWGGYADTIPVKIKVVTTTANEIVQIPDLGNGYTDDSFIMKSESGTRLSNGKLQFASPGTYNVELYPFSYEYAVRLPRQTSSITDWGETIRLQSSYNMGALYQTKVTYIPYGNKLFSDLTWIASSGAYGPDWFQTTTITDVDDNLLENCAGVTVIDGSNTLGVFNMDLTEEKYTTVLSKLTNLQRINYLFAKKVTSTCGIFKNNPGLTNAKKAFSSQNLVTLPIDEFSNCKELTNVEGIFTNCAELTNMPHFRDNKKITNFREAFAGCSKLTGSTPTDENGYKLWERAGKEGYPTAIDGIHCFQGCTQLDDYDEIPDNWK